MYGYNAKYMIYGSINSSLHVLSINYLFGNCAENKLLKLLPTEEMLKKLAELPLYLCAIFIPMDLCIESALPLAWSAEKG